MQDPSIYQHQNINPPIFPDQQEHQKCPRCESDNTKFCYYNNYNLSQPRYFCKNCKRYWTKGGSLRNIPVGGTIRKNTKKTPNPKIKSPKLSSNSSPSTFTYSSPAPITPSSSNVMNSGHKSEPGPVYGASVEQSINGGFSSLVSSSGQFGNIFNGFAQNLNSEGGLGLDLGKNLDLELQRSDHHETECFLGVQNGDSRCWNADDDDEGGSNGWPDLAI